jgi:hypothetical protein
VRYLALFSAVALAAVGQQADRPTVFSYEQLFPEVAPPPSTLPAEVTSAPVTPSGDYLLTSPGITATEVIGSSSLMSGDLRRPSGVWRWRYSPLRILLRFSRTTINLQRIPPIRFRSPLPRLPIALRVSVYHPPPARQLWQSATA